MQKLVSMWIGEGKVEKKERDLGLIPFPVGDLVCALRQVPFLWGTSVSLFVK